MATSKKKKKKKSKKKNRGLKVLLTFVAMALAAVVIYLVVGQLQQAMFKAKIVEVQPDMTLGGLGKAPGQFEQPWDVAVDGQGNIIVTDFSNHRLQKFDSTGKLIFCVGKEGKAPGEFNQPSGVYVDPSGQIYVCDTFNYRIQKFDANGHFLKEWSHSFYGPKGITGNGHGIIYVVDTGNHKVQVFDDNGNYLKEWGSHGDQPGQFKEPIGGAVDPKGFVYVADTDNLRIQKFDPNGKPVGSFKIPTWRGKNFETPYLAYGDGFLWATNTSEGSILKFTLSGKLKAIYKAKGSGFSDPSGVAVGPEGQVYVTERDTGKVQRFTPPPAPGK